ncbi:hypothetical protein AB0I51_47510 [Streptomyces sp. NPDC050549]|uniref:hypothetical protein n=1 Tax=Streptomyces sp. NPDC050549 TaxID=3155406 RepID=UPI003437B8B3
MKTRECEPGCRTKLDRPLPRSNGVRFLHTLPLLPPPIMFRTPNAVQRIRDSAESCKPLLPQQLSVAISFTTLSSARLKQVRND